MGVRARALGSYFGDKAEARKHKVNNTIPPSDPWTRFTDFAVPDRTKLSSKATRCGHNEDHHPGTRME